MIKEEGLAISPSFYSNINSDTTILNTSISLYCFYAQPLGYENNLRAFMNDSPIKLQILQSHIGLINVKFNKKGKYEFKVIAQLTNNKKIISQDSCIKNIIVF